MSINEELSNLQNNETPLSDEGEVTPSKVQSIRTRLSDKRESYSLFVREHLLINKRAPFKSGALVSIVNCIIVVVSILPALALRILEFPFYVLIDRFLPTFMLVTTTLFLLFIRYGFMEAAPIVNKYFTDIFIGLQALFLQLQPSLLNFKKQSFFSKVKTVSKDAAWFTFDAEIISHEEAIHRFLVETPQECASFDSAWVILQRMFQSFASEGVCESLRYLIPTPALYDVLDGTAGWMSIENPVTLQSQCLPAERIDVLCTSLGMGYVFAQLIVPIYLGILFLALSKEEVTLLIMVSSAFAAFKSVAPYL